MKHLTSTLVIAISLLLLQGCGPSTKKAEDQKDKLEAAQVGEAVLASTERHLRLQKERSRQIEMRQTEREQEASITPFYTDADGFIVFNKAEVEPMFIGGDDALNKYLADHTNYPDVAKTAGLEATIFVDFVVAANGQIRQAHVDATTDGDAGQSLRTEAIRVVTTMPKWTPGSQRRKVVDVKFSVPITFQLD
jgi:hypothetical protein